MSRPTTVITGGQGDLARALASRLTDQEWTVHAPGRAELDVTSADSVRTYLDQIEGPIHLLINNAGCLADGSILKMTEEAWDRVLDTNLKGAFLCSQQVLRRMLKQREGHILNIGSFSALSPPLGQANYAAAKAGLIGLTQSLAKEAGSRGVRVNCVLPGFLETRMTRDLPEAVIEAARNRHALGRFNTAEDVARFVETLQELTAVSGQVFQLDSRIVPWD